MRPDDELGSEFLVGLCCFSLLCGLALCLLVLAAEFLHSVTDGRVPRLVDWQPGSARTQQRSYAAEWEEEHGDEEEEELEEIEEIITSAPARH